jgi:membrane-bound lytic murein transglycosylase D
LQGRLLTVPVQVAATSKGEPLASPPPAEPTDQRGSPSTWLNKYYTIKKGDTLSTLARRFKVTARILTAWNNLKIRVALKPGKRLIIAKYQDKKGSAAGESG